MIPNSVYFLTRGFSLITCLSVINESNIIKKLSRLFAGNMMDLVFRYFVGRNLGVVICFSND